MIIYKCKVPASTDLRGVYEEQQVEIQSVHPMTARDIRRAVIDKVDKKYVSFGHVTFTEVLED